MTLGNPAPLGLLCFGMTTLLLMYVEMGWVEVEFEVQIYGTAVFLGGVGQILVAIFEIIKGSSFSFAVFGCYGAFWLGWAFVFLERHNTNSSFGHAVYTEGSTAFLAQWGVLSTCFWVVARRKNICLNIIFALLSLTFYLLAIATSTGSEQVKKAAGYMGFFTAAGAFYTGVAELINEEYGRNVLPGLAARITPYREEITVDSISGRTAYDKRSNTLFLSFRGLHIRTPEAVAAIKESVKASIMAAQAPNNKVHVVVDYKDVIVAEPVLKVYWAMVAELEREYYLSAKRFAVSSFGTYDHEPVGVTASGLAPVAAKNRKGMYDRNGLGGMAPMEIVNEDGNETDDSKVGLVTMRSDAHEEKESDERARLTANS
eukprot:CAMPEP_0197023200 /NCGR_PEP_ID=MMETSP1384-20130603/3979_1 /TAXON_ID=29189 /ORGANISM="Ammonia sp." /LENGTH=372 /DNA_ID=CAMNT_0042451391 /DNA_START=14 /DNA_END=1132 /DNA_ORIENTATION=+